MPAQLTIGPILFHWPADQWRDFYYRIADEAPVGTVYVGEAVCGKRTPFYAPLYADVRERLTRGGKKVVFSTLAEVMIKHDRKIVENMCSTDETLVEANDSSALWYLSGKPHAIGPFLNAYNEITLAHLSRKGARHICLPFELPAGSIAVMTENAKKNRMTAEVFVFGRVPLALSARCYHARAHGRVKDNCQFICGEDKDGMNLNTLDGKPFLCINGIQTMSHTFLNLAAEMTEMEEMGVTHFRLSPHGIDMISISKRFRDVLDGRIDSHEMIALLEQDGLPTPQSNGFYHGREGYIFHNPS